jgi:hypothetical protein
MSMDQRWSAILELLFVDRGNLFGLYTWPVFLHKRIETDHEARILSQVVTVKAEFWKRI